MHILKIPQVAAVFICLSGAMVEAHAGQQTIPASETGSPELTSTVSDTSPDRNIRSSAVAITARDVIQDKVLGLTWISRQPPGNYTVQLMAAVSPGSLLAFVRKESLDRPLAIAGFRKKDRELYLLLQGSYATSGEAENASARIQQETGVQPWVRKFSSLPELFERSKSVPSIGQDAKQPPPPVMGAAWLWSRNPVHYTIQLMEDRRADTLRAFAAKHRPASPLAIIRVRHRGKSWYLLVSGDYGGEGEAIAAIKRLPKGVTGGGPWPRRFATLQDEMAGDNL